MQYRASHILVKDKELAQRLLKMAKSGSSFSLLAKDFSTCPSKSKGGDLGFFSKGSMVKSFEDAVIKMRINQLELVKTQFGFHIIKKTGEK